MLDIKQLRKQLQPVASAQITPQRSPAASTSTSWGTWSVTRRRLAVVVIGWGGRVRERMRVRCITCLVLFATVALEVAPSSFVHRIYLLESVKSQPPHRRWVDRGAFVTCVAQIGRRLVVLVHQLSASFVHRLFSSSSLAHNLATKVT